MKTQLIQFASAMNMIQIQLTKVIGILRNKLVQSGLEFTSNEINDKEDRKLSIFSHEINDKGKLEDHSH
jgi:hypothetical protein